MGSRLTTGWLPLSKALLCAEGFINGISMNPFDSIRRDLLILALSLCPSSRAICPLPSLLWAQEADLGGQYQWAPMYLGLWLGLSKKRGGPGGTSGERRQWGWDMNPPGSCVAGWLCIFPKPLPCWVICSNSSLFQALQLTLFLAPASSGLEQRLPLLDPGIALDPVDLPKPHSYICM